jgi:hypothetical protein
VADPPDDSQALLLAAKALVFCGFPYQRSSLTTVVREAHLGADTHLTVYISTTEPNVSAPFGADRALLAWITTLTYDTGFVTFTSLTEFSTPFASPVRASSTTASRSGSVGSSASL